MLRTVAAMAAELGGRLVTITERAVVVAGWTSSAATGCSTVWGYQVHDVDRRHHRTRRGRADLVGLHLAGRCNIVTSTVPAALTDQRIAVLDVEGNGRQPPEIIEITVLTLDDGVTSENLHRRPSRVSKPTVIS